MKYEKLDSDNYLLRLEVGEKIMETLCQFTTTQNIKSGVVSGLGAVKDSKLGFYQPEKKEYIERLFEEDTELASLNGNVCWMGETPMAHCHVTLADIEFRAIAGHLFESTTAVTVELYVRDLKPNPEKAVSRKWAQSTQSWLLLGITNQSSKRCLCGLQNLAQHLRTVLNSGQYLIEKQKPLPVVIE